MGTHFSASEEGTCFWPTGGCITTPSPPLPMCGCRCSMLMPPGKGKHKIFNFWRLATFLLECLLCQCILVWRRFVEYDLLKAFWVRRFVAQPAGRGVRIGGGEMVTLMTLGFLSRGVGRRRTLFFAPSLYTFLLWNRNHQRRAIKMYRRPRRRKSEDALHLWGFNYSSCYCC